MHLYPLQRDNSILHQLRKKAVSGVQGTSGNDVYQAPEGKSAYDGGTGYDTVVFPKGRNAYDINIKGLTLAVSDNRGFEIVTSQVEELNFANDAQPLFVVQHHFHLDII